MRERDCSHGSNKQNQTCLRFKKNVICTEAEYLHMLFFHFVPLASF